MPRPFHLSLACPSSLSANRLLRRFASRPDSPAPPGKYGSLRDVSSCGSVFWKKRPSVAVKILGQTPRVQLDFPDFRQVCSESVPFFTARRGRAREPAGPARKRLTISRIRPLARLPRPRVNKTAKTPKTNGRKFPQRMVFRFCCEGSLRWEWRGKATSFVEDGAKRAVLGTEVFGVRWLDAALAVPKRDHGHWY
jgi:hypothetical protein